MVPPLKMEKWNAQAEEEITLLVKDWLKQQGKTQKDLRKALNASSERMPVLLTSLKAEYISGGLPKLLSTLCAIEHAWINAEQKSAVKSQISDPFSQLDLLLEEINEDCNN